MGKRKRVENCRVPLHEEKLDETQSLDVSSSNLTTHEEIAIPKEIGPPINCRPIFVLDKASLRIGIVRKKRKILSAEEDADFLLSKGKNLDDYQPEMFFEALSQILDSKINRVHGIGAVYVKTNSGILFEVKPHARIPRTWERFHGIMLELLEKSCVRANKTGEVRFRVLKGPLTQHLPNNAHVVGFSYSSPKIVVMEDYVSAIKDDLSLVLVVGAMDKGKVDKVGTNDYLSVSNYPLSTSFCLGIICRALERKWKVT